MKHLLSSITLFFLSTLAFGQVPNTFSSGETISSSKINANFSFLADAIARGNVDAMMVCQNYGKETNTDEFTFGKCSASDNSSFNTSGNGWRDYVGYSKTESYMTLSDVLSEKWILHNTFGISRQNSTNNPLILFFFYKVSSD